MTDLSTQIKGNSKRRQFPNLDGLRTLAFLGVYFYHSFHTEYSEIKQNSIYLFVTNFFRNGDLGVNFFFVLSGFLITHLLMLEESKLGKISLLKFYMRRLLRIWPLYFGCVLFGFVFFPMIKSLFGQVPSETADFMLFLSFLGNFNNIFNGLPDASILGVLWSVAIEEQFYLIWPLLLMIFTKRRNLLIAIIIVGNLLFRLYYFDNPTFLYFHTLSVMSNLAIGCWCGYMTFQHDCFVNFFKNVSLSQNIIVYTTLAIFIIYRNFIFQNQFFVMAENLIFSIFFGWVLLEQIYSKSSIIKIGNIKYFNFWGKYTYGLYCLHFIGILISINISKFFSLNNSLFVVLVIETLLALILTHIIAWLSFNYFEKRFLEFKTKFQLV